jgi:hypothetical protein
VAQDVEDHEPEPQRDEEDPDQTLTRADRLEWGGSPTHEADIGVLLDTNVALPGGGGGGIKLMGPAFLAFLILMIVGLGVGAALCTVTLLGGVAMIVGISIFGLLVLVRWL